MCKYECNFSEMYSAVVISIKAIRRHKTSKAPTCMYSRIVYHVHVLTMFLTHTHTHDSYDYSYIHIQLLDQRSKNSKGIYLGV